MILQPCTGSAIGFEYPFENWTSGSEFIQKKKNFHVNLCQSLLVVDDLDGVNIPQDGIRKSRSHSFSSSLKNLFKKKKKNKQHHQNQGGSELYPPSSRESSVSRASGEEATIPLLLNLVPTCQVVTFPLDILRT